VPVSAPVYCQVSVLRDYNTPPFAYKAVLKLDPYCPEGGIGRVRKVSTLNQFARYRPQQPDGSEQFGGLWAWELRKKGSVISTVPPKKLWTTFSWIWQWWDGSTWQRALRP
jgi:hypothetical protein